MLLAAEPVFQALSFPSFINLRWKLAMVVYTFNLCAKAEVQWDLYELEASWST